MIRRLTCICRRCCDGRGGRCRDVGDLMQTEDVKREAHEWWSHQGLPEHGRAEWAIWKGRSIACAGIEEVQQRLMRWKPIDAILVGAPGALSFMVPPSVPTLAARVTRNVRRRMKISLVILGLVTMAVV